MCFCFIFINKGGAPYVPTYRLSSPQLADPLPPPRDHVLFPARGSPRRELRSENHFDKIGGSRRRKKQDGWMNNEPFFLLFYTRTGQDRTGTGLLLLPCVLTTNESLDRISNSTKIWWWWWWWIQSLYREGLLNQSNQDYIHSRLSQPRLGNCTVGWWSFLDLLLLNQLIIHSTKSFNRSTKDFSNQSINQPRLGNCAVCCISFVWKYEYSPLRGYPLLYWLNSIFNSS